MTAYFTTAGNKFEWCTLCVAADSEDQAAEKFDAFLKSAFDASAEHAEWAKNADGETDYDVSDFIYRYNQIIAEDNPYAFSYTRNWTGKPSNDVQILTSDGNG